MGLVAYARGGPSRWRPSTVAARAGSPRTSAGSRGNTLKGHIIRGLDGPPEKMLFREIFLDCAQLAGIVMGLDTVDETRVGAFGGSQGGALTFVTAALEPRIKRAAPVYPFLSDYRRVWEMDLAENAYSELKEYFRKFDPLHAAGKTRSSRSSATSTSSTSPPRIRGRGPHGGRPDGLPSAPPAPSSPPSTRSPARRIS